MSQLRTTIRLDDALIGAAKAHARETDRSLTDLIRDAVTALLERERSMASPRQIRLATFKGEGLHKGVDLDRSQSILERMEHADQAK